MKCHSYVNKVVYTSLCSHFCMTHFAMWYQIFFGMWDSVVQDNLALMLLSNDCLTDCLIGEVLYHLRHKTNPQKFVASDSEPPLSIQSRSCPIDWCLHTRVRFTSQASFEWSNRISSSEESCGITNFVLCKYQDQTSTQEESSLSEVKFQQVFFI